MTKYYDRFNQKKRALEGCYLIESSSKKKTDESSFIPLSLGMIKDVKVFAHVNLDEYIHVALLEGLMIAGKKRLALIGDTGLRALEASKWNIVGLWRLIERDKTLTKDLLGLKMRSTKSRLCSGGSTATTCMNEIDGTEIVHVGAGQPITVAAMADVEGMGAT
ncbi:hypothetical protein Tco_1199128, partial [Tanacetum coccineum]